jgi:endonuclease YncB( thermonuclease family)
MRKGSIVVGVLAIVAIAAGSVVAGSNAVTGKCVKVVDGDTLIVECDQQRRTVEIDGIDAPELGQPWGKEVRGFVRDMVGGEQVEIVVVEGDGDTVRARVLVNGTDLSEMLVGRGLAWVSEGSADSELVELCGKAKSMPCGLWIDGDAQPPWEYRATAS